MELRTISASSLTTFEECPRRWRAENLERVPRTGGPGPAGVGTACHEALELFVVKVWVEKTHEDSFVLLAGLYRVAYIKVFNSADLNTPEYKDGLDMLEKWYSRTSLDGIEILSTEKKDFMPIKTSEGVKKYNYIWDRCDKFVESGKVIIRVVDYKSIRANLSPEDLREKIQAKMYAMAAAFQFKELEPDEIWIMFDLLRYGTVEVKFTRDQNLETWKYVKETAERIITMDGERAPETLGPGCSFCVRKTNCESLLKNQLGGGIMSLADDRNLLAERRLQLDGVMKGAKYAMEEIDNMMLRNAKDTDEIEYETDKYKVSFTSRRTKYYDNEEVREIVGDSIYSQIGGVTNTAVEKLLKGSELTSAQKSLLRGSVKIKNGELKPKITKKT